MIFLFVIYFIVGVLVNFGVKGMENSPTPFDDESLGIIIIWPLFVLKAVLIAWVWVMTNLVSSVGGAAKNLIGRK